jgi:hypothetical protein
MAATALATGSSHRGRALGRRTALAFALAATLLVLGGSIATSLAHAAYGDNFGLAPINDGPGPAQEVPAMPEASNVFWAGTCDLAAAPEPPSAIDGGIGSIPSTITAPDAAAQAFGFGRATVAASPRPPHCIDWGGPSVGNTAIWDHVPAWRLPAHTQAGGHPDGTARFSFARVGENEADGAVDNIYVDLPPGFVGDPTAVTKCTAEQFAVRPLLCPASSQVGIMHLEIVGAFGGSNLTAGRDESVYPIFNIEPRKGNVAELGFGYASGEKATTVRIVAKARTNSDFGVTTFVGQIPAALPVRAQQITLWGVPWASVNNRWRAATGFRGDRQANPGTCSYQPGLPSETFGFGVNIYYVPPAGFTTPGCATGYSPEWGPIKPFISNVTECTGGALNTRFATDSFQHQGAFSSEGDPILPKDNTLPGWRVYDASAPALTRCNAVPFNAGIDLQPSTAAADAASGLSADLTIPQNNKLPFSPPAAGADQATVDQYVSDATAHWKSDAGLSTANLDKAVVTLPEGFSINPSAATGLDGCSDGEMGVRQQGNPLLFNNGDPFDGDPSDGAECPPASIIGTAEVKTPLLEQPLKGRVVLGDPKSTDPTSGEMFRTFIVLEDDERGLIAKIYGSAVADPNTGQLTATFDKNPRVPFESMHLEFKGGDKGLLGTPQRCADRGWASTFTPWTAAHGAGGQAVPSGGAMATNQNCGFGFAPGLLAGMDNQQGGGSGKFAFRFDRTDGQQWLRGLTADLPQGLLASVKDVPLCPAANAGAGTCGAESRIGSVDAAAGSGNPFFLEKKGDVYLTEGYKGAPYGLSVKVPVEAGPFRGEFALPPIVVQQALYVDPTDAHVTAVSDPFPIIHRGIPLRVREVTVTVDRPGFMRNPTDCSPKAIKALFTSAEGTQASAAQRFQASGCSKLGFKPKLTMQLTGKKQTTTGKHPGVKALVTQTSGEAGVEKAVVRLPRSLALDPDNAQALCEFTTGTQPDLEKRCPKGSIVGRAKAESPLLRRPLTGNAYFVKNVRKDPKTGNEIRTLPMIVVALRGEIAVNLRGESSTTKDGRLVNTFAAVPDAPIKQFNLNIKGGKNGILAVTRTKAKRINICSGKHVAEADFDGQNGKQHDRDVKLKTPCKAKRSAKKGGAKKGAAKKRSARSSR